MSADLEKWPDPSEIMTFEDGDPNENPWVIGPPQPEAIVLEPHSDEWARRFEQARNGIAAALQHHVLTIDHIGSSAVPGLLAKPVIDIDLIVADPDEEDRYIPPLLALGYRLTVRERGWYRHRMLRHDNPRINLHVFGPGCPEHIRCILFRDWLRSHPEDRDRYGAIKPLATIDAATVEVYNGKKEQVIREIYRKIFISRGWLNG